MIALENAHPLDNIIKQGKILEHDIISAFVFGSRAFGTATESSDYDVYIVVRSKKNRQRIENLYIFFCSFCFVFRFQMLIMESDAS